MLKALFTSGTRLKLLAHFFNHPFRSFYLRELQRLLGESLTPLRRELGKMEQIGLLVSRREKNQKYFRLNRDFIIYPELQNIFSKLCCPGPGAQRVTLVSREDDRPAPARETRPIELLR